MNYKRLIPWIMIAVWGFLMGCIWVGHNEPYAGGIQDMTTTLWLMGTITFIMGISYISGRIHGKASYMQYGD